MSMTYAELKSAVLFNTFSTSRYGTFVARWLNDAVLDVCQMFELFPSVESAQLSVSTPVTLTQNFWKVNEVRLGRSYVGTNPDSIAADVTGTVLAPAGSNLVAPGSSIDGYYYFRYLPEGGSQFSVTLPRPSIVVVQGLTRPPIMSADSDLSGLPSEVDDALVAFARARAFRYEDDFAMAQMWQGEYVARLGAVQPSFVETGGPEIIPGCWDESAPGPFDQGLRRG